jgi:hypothetical protein
MSTEDEPTEAELREAGKKRLAAMLEKHADSYRSLRFEDAGGKDHVEVRDDA